MAVIHEDQCTPEVIYGGFGKAHSTRQRLNVQLSRYRLFAFWRGRDARILVVAVKCVGQIDLGNVLSILILDDLGIDEEGHRHFDVRSCGECLLGETEALDLCEVEPRRLRADRAT